jgi:hypothetical protein
VQKSKVRNLATIIIAVITLILAFQSCKDDSVSVVNTSDDLHSIIPMRVGASWTYFNNFVALYSDDPPDTAFIHLSIIKKDVTASLDTLNSQWWVISESSFVYQSEPKILLRVYNYLEKVDDSSYQRLSWFDIPLTILKKPITNGNSWDWGYLLHSDTTFSIFFNQYEHAIVSCMLGSCPLVIARGYGILYERQAGDNLEYSERTLISTNINQ